MTGPLLLTAWLDSPLAGEPPQLDALLEWSLCPFEESFRARQDAGLPHSRIDRKYPAPPQGNVPIPIQRARLGRWQVALCSSPILPVSTAETVEHVCKRVSVENAGLLAEDEQKIVSTTNSWTKSYRLPLRIRTIPCVRWFCMSQWGGLKRALRHVHSLGKKVADGYGRISRWTADPVPVDCSWFARHAAGMVLMRPLPLLLDDREWLPRDLLGYRRHFGSCVPPYWHPERFTEIVTPC